MSEWGQKDSAPGSSPRPLAIAALLLGILSIVVAVVTNVDSVHADIRAWFPWAHDTCRMWSGTFIGLMVAISASGFVLARASGKGVHAGRFLPSAASWLAIAGVVYWIVVLFFGRGDCIGGIE